MRTFEYAIIDKLGIHAGQAGMDDRILKLSDAFIFVYYRI